MRRTLLLLAVTVLVAGCESAPIKAVRQTFSDIFHGQKGEADFNAGIKSYDNANYTESARQLQSALDQGLYKSNQAQAHKYLAFIHCVSGRPAQCRNEFRKALDVDPDFVLQPAEAGHPQWGPVFTSVKSRR
jgi:Tfp pilus assembly protein PilF